LLSRLRCCASARRCNSCASRAISSASAASCAGSIVLGGVEIGGEGSGEGGGAEGDGGDSDIVSGGGWEQPAATSRMVTRVSNKINIFMARD
jgi:hypothetical protein